MSSLLRTQLLLTLEWGLWTLVTVLRSNRLFVLWKFFVNWPLRFMGHRWIWRVLHAWVGIWRWEFHFFLTKLLYLDWSIQRCFCSHAFFGSTVVFYQLIMMVCFLRRIRDTIYFVCDLCWCLRDGLRDTWVRCVQRCIIALACPGMPSSKLILAFAWITSRTCQSDLLELIK